MPIEEYSHKASSAPNERDTCATSNTEPQKRPQILKSADKPLRPPVPNRPLLEAEDDIKAGAANDKLRQEAELLLKPMNLDMVYKHGGPATLDAPLGHGLRMTVSFKTKESLIGYIAQQLPFLKAGVQLGKESIMALSPFDQRDAEVERLRDQEKRRWKKIRNRIKAHPEWSIGQDGTPITKRALKEAYKERKAMAKAVSQVPQVGISRQNDTAHTRVAVQGALVRTELS